MSRFIIVGAGAFGASTALHLAREEPNATIYLFSLPPDSAQPASIDINKIVRSEYKCDLYRRLADEAVKAWKHEHFKTFYHESGWILIHGYEDSSLPRPPPESKQMTEEELGQCFGSVFEGCELKGAKDVTYNESVAWVEATKALEKTIELARAKGVIYRREEIKELCFDDEKCSGVRLKEDGTELRGDSVVLAMGPWTAPFIARHTRLQPPIGLFTNAGVSTAMITLNEDEASKYSQMPILAYSARGEIMPPDKNRNIKVTNARSFTNGALATRGPDWGTPSGSGLANENRNLLAQFLPQFKGRPFSHVWYCCDWITPYQDFLVCHVPPVKDLYVAAGGSYHGFKFLPIIGKYITQMIRGTLDPELKRRWEWDRSGREGYTDIHGDVIPKRVVQ